MAVYQDSNKRTFRNTLIKLKYPLNLINSTIATFVDSVAQPHGEISEADRETQKPVRITLPFKDQKSADAARKQLKDLGKKIGTDRDSSGLHKC